jgi:hypothetical protein
MTFQKLLAVYDTEPDNFPRLMELMFDMQAFGQPPADIIKDLAPGLKFDENGMPIMANMYFLNLILLTYSYTNTYTNITNTNTYTITNNYTNTNRGAGMMPDSGPDGGMPQMGDLAYKMSTGQCTIA